MFIQHITPLAFGEGHGGEAVLFSFHRFHMYADKRALSEAVAQALLGAGDDLMCFHQCQVAGHTHVHLYGDVTADAACAQMMDVAEASVFRDSVFDGRWLSASVP